MNDLCTNCIRIEDETCDAVTNEITLEGAKIIECLKYVGKPNPYIPNKRTFESGATRSISIDKGRFDLLPWTAIQELAIHCAKGAEVHGENNVNLGIPIHSLIDSAIRHLSDYMRGETSEKHLVSAMWNIGFAIQTEILMPEYQDISNRIKGEL